MNKKKYLLISFAVLGCIFITAISISLTQNKNNQETPLIYLIEAINNKDIDELPNAFHEYCLLCIKQNISEEDFNKYINTIINDFGNDYRVSYEIVNVEKLSKEDINTYEMNALYTYSNYPYLSDGGKLDFEDIINITANIIIKGNKQEQNSTVDFLVVKIDEKYYFLHTPNQMMSYFINY